MIFKVNCRMQIAPPLFIQNQIPGQRVRVNPCPCIAIKYVCISALTLSLSIELWIWSFLGFCFPFPTNTNVFICFNLKLEMDKEELTEHETALYDRQVRVWGADAQRRYFYLFESWWLNYNGWLTERTSTLYYLLA